MNFFSTFIVLCPLLAITGHAATHVCSQGFSAVRNTMDQTSPLSWLTSENTSGDILIHMDGENAVFRSKRDVPTELVSNFGPFSLLRQNGLPVIRNLPFLAKVSQRSSIIKTTANGSILIAHNLASNDFHPLNFERGRSAGNMPLAVAFTEQQGENLGGEVLTLYPDGKIHQVSLLGGKPQVIDTTQRFSGANKSFSMVKNSGLRTGDGRHAFVFSRLEWGSYVSRAGSDTHEIFVLVFNPDGSLDFSKRITLQNCIALEDWVRTDPENLNVLQIRYESLMFDESAQFLRDEKKTLFISL